MTKHKDDLRKKISGSQLFVVLATKCYLKSLKDDDRYITTQIGIARDLKKPFFIIKDSKLSKGEEDEIDQYFSKDNIIKETRTDVGSKNSARNIASEIKQMISCMCPCADEEIRLVTQDPIDED